MAAEILEPTRGANVGRVVVRVKLENYADVERAELGEIPVAQAPRIEVDALVDSGATYFCLPKSLIDQLGLRFRGKKQSKTVSGLIELGVYAAARIETQVRDCVTEVMELPEGRQCLFGQIPLELMDWWIDARNQRLAGNPEHGGQWMAEAF